MRSDGTDMIGTVTGLAEDEPGRGGAAAVAPGAIPPHRADALDEIHPHLRAAPPTRVAPIKRAAGGRLARFLSWLGWAALGLGVLVAAWTLAAARAHELPSPLRTARTFVELMKDPFRNDGPNDKGIGWQFVASLERVFFGFGIAVAIGVPFGLVIGSSKRAWRAANPVIQLLRPVSPLAWFPIWLYVVKSSPQAAKYVICITALWPILINTASAAQSIPSDQRNVSKVFRFNRRTQLRHVLVPNALPGIVTGMRLSMGVAWMVIVAVEMMSVGTGVGFFVWDAYNAGDLSKVMSAIVLIGFVGLALDATFLRLGKRCAIEGART